MSAEPLGLVAWKNGGPFTKWHIERLTFPYSLFCPAVPPKHPERIDRKAAIDGEDICEKCRAALDEQTARNLKVIA